MKKDEHTKLMKEGVHLMLQQISKDLESGSSDDHLRALRTLAGMAKRQSNGEPARTVQEAFRSVSGFRSMVLIVNSSMVDITEDENFQQSPESPAIIDSGVKRATFNAALECLRELLWHCPENCLAATNAGVISALTGCCYSESDVPPNPVTLKLLHQLVTCEKHKVLIHDAIVSCLTVPTLVRLLEASLLNAPPEHRSTWSSEVLGVLSPLVHDSQDAAEQIVTMGGLHSLTELVKQPATEPLPLSQMFDILEVLVSTGEKSFQQEVRHMIVRNGLLQPILQALRRSGLNLQAIGILSYLVQEQSIVRVLQAVISPRSLHELCKAAVDGCAVEDLQASACGHIVTQLLSDESLLSLRNLVLGRCLNVALKLPQPSNDIVTLAMSSVGQEVIDNLAHEFRFDTALAACHLFCSCPDPSLLTKQDRLATLLGAAMDEAAAQTPRSDSLSFLSLVSLQDQLDALNTKTPDDTNPLFPSSPTQFTSRAASNTPSVVCARLDNNDLEYTSSVHECASDASTPFVASSPRKPPLVRSRSSWRSVSELRQESAFTVSQNQGRSQSERRSSGESASFMSMGSLVRSLEGALTGHGVSAGSLAPLEEEVSVGSALHGSGVTVHVPAPPISKDDVNKKRYDTVTFLVGNREFYALGWVLEQSCPGLRDALQQVDDVNLPLRIPQVQHMQDTELYHCFSLLVEYAYTGSAEITDDECPGVWALAASLSFSILKEHCQSRMLTEGEDLLARGTNLQKTLLWSSLYDSDGPLHTLCCGSVLADLERAWKDGLLTTIAKAGTCRNIVLAGLSICLNNKVVSATGSGGAGHFI